MTVPAIETRELSKTFRVYRKPWHRVAETLSRGSRIRHDEVHAVQDVSLAIEPGRAVGIIGKNGAGKTTLLKLLTGVMQPTHGEAAVRGRVASFLELNAGFHPDFTGRQNIRINCAVLGMTEAEVRERSPDIIAFAELGEFIDRPVRTYSTGMFMRLGFSVAAFVDPDVLIVDEALSVGDEYFRGKCYQRINEFRAAGKTIVLVSHDLSLVRLLCDQVVLMEGGRAVTIGDPQDVAETYLATIYERAAREGELHPDEHAPSAAHQPKARRGTGAVSISEVRLLAGDGTATQLLRTGRPMEVRFRYTAHEAVARALFGINIFRADGILCISTNQECGEHTAHFAQTQSGVGFAPAPRDLAPGDAGEVTVRLDSLPLLGGQYSLSVNVFTGEGALPQPVEELFDVMRFEVYPDTFRDKGLLLAHTKWDVT